MEYKYNNTNKKVRKAVRIFLIENDRIVVIKYNSKVNKDYYDIPGGKIEEKESSLGAATREFKEETGMKIINHKFIGNAIIEYPDRIFDLDLYTAFEYEGIPENFEENDSMWIMIDEILKEEKTFPSIKILEYLKEDNNEKIKIKINCNDNHEIQNIEKKIELKY